MLFLLDENLPDDLADLIRSRGHHVLTASNSRRRPLTDPDVWDWAAREKAIFVTRDLDFPLPGRRPAPFAVILLRGRFLTREALLTLWSKEFHTLDASAVEGRVISVRPGHPFRSRRFI